MPANRPPTIDLSAALDALGEDLCRRLPELAHIDPNRVLFALARSRASGTHGTYARIIPLRFAAGRRETRKRRRGYLETYRMPELTHDGREVLYLIHIFVPRFLRLPFREKLATVVHELFHISEQCDGDLRRFPGRNFAHGGSRRRFHRRVADLAENYLETGPDPTLLEPLRLEEGTWREGKVRLSGLRVPLPRAQMVAREKL